MPEIDTLKAEIADLERRLARLNAEPAVVALIERQIAQRRRRLRQLEALSEFTPLSAG